MFLQGLCNDSTVLSSKFSYGISTSYEGVVVANNEVDGISGPALLEMVKDIRNIASPLMSLLRLALEHATPCAAGLVTNSSRFYFYFLTLFLCQFLQPLTTAVTWLRAPRSTSKRAGGLSRFLLYFPALTPPQAAP